MKTFGFVEASRKQILICQSNILTTWTGAPKWNAAVVNNLESRHAAVRRNVSVSGMMVSHQATSGTPLFWSCVDVILSSPRCSSSCQSDTQWLKLKDIVVYWLRSIWELMWHVTFRFRTQLTRMFIWSWLSGRVSRGAEVEEEAVAPGRLLVSSRPAGKLLTRSRCRHALHHAHPHR